MNKIKIMKKLIKKMLIMKKKKKKNIDKILNILNNCYSILYIDKIYDYITINKKYIEFNTINNIDINKLINEDFNNHNKLIINSIIKNKKNLTCNNKIENINSYLFTKSNTNATNYKNHDNSIDNYYDINELNNKMIYLNNEIIKSIKEINNDINKL